MNFESSTSTFRSVGVMQPNNPVGWPAAPEQSTISFGRRFDKSDVLEFPSSPKSTFDQPPSPTHKERKNIAGGEGQWVWDFENASPLPTFYPIQEWNTVAVENIPLNVLAGRISEFLRTNSIAADYNNNNNNNNDGFVLCRTLSGAEFAINIWQSVAPEMAKKSGLLVHCQKIRGCSMELGHLRRKLRQAVLHEAEEAPRRRSSRQSVQSIENLITMEIETINDVTPDNSPLQVCTRMLLKKDEPSNSHLGLESLANLTDKSKTVSDAAKEASAAVLSDCELQNVLKEHFSRNEIAHPGGRLLALRILAQSLENIKAPINFAANPSFWQTALCALLEDIRQADSRPLEAWLSVRSLGHLMNEQIQQLSTIVNIAALDGYVQSAHEFGSKHNLMLQKETRNLVLCRSQAPATAR